MTVAETADRRGAVYATLVSALRAAGVSFAASLPDDWVVPLCSALDREPAIMHVRVAREPEIIGLCAGSFFGGVRAVGVMGATGFLACVSEIATLSRRYQIPMVLVVSQRGTIHDHQVFQEVQGRVAAPIADVLGLPSLILDSDERIRLVPDAIETSRLQKRPMVLWIAKALLTGSVAAA